MRTEGKGLERWSHPGARLERGVAGGGGGITGAGEKVGPVGGARSLKAFVPYQGVCT